jgi:crotonobetainyl-CoA:carnitine CoA-transferase CaiB-like acyl-CoA transferase
MHGGRTPEIYQCQDGLVVGAIGPARGRQAIREWLASEGKAGDLFDKKWDDIFLKGAPLNLEQKTHIDKLFQDFALHHTRDELMSEAQRRDIQVVKEQDVRDVMDDPHLREREYFVKVKHPELNESIIYPGAPFKSTEMSWQYSKRAPYIGEHNHEIYVEELGLTIQELAILKEGGVI